MGSSAQLNRRLIDATGRLAIGGSLLPAVAFLATAVLLEAGVSSIMLLFLLFLVAAATLYLGTQERSGFGEETCVPPSLSYIPPDRSLRAAREEAELIIFSAVDALFAKAAPRRAAGQGDDVDVVIVCCSVSAPDPALSDMIVNRYGMRSDVRSVNLSGMGCGAGLIAVDLAASLLRAMPRGARALVVSTEILSSSYYVGAGLSMVAANCLFRMSGAAMLMSTSATAARFRLGCAVRTCSATQDSAYRSVFQEEGDKRNLGARVERGFAAVAGDKIKANIVAFEPRVLPASELLVLTLSAVARL
ncbi:3-ketoacyl-CoA synthase 6-like [Panicum virgatum]|uniref:3-ketoacyl-CoA synthase 6-like n=1 Tax=Panicum virgatum TaxID=38727 RepID=UPI0019D60A6D|nr:3-ketoacyl-CoA synthase 6-like [Panicum virgatum]